MSSSRQTKLGVVSDSANRRTSESDAARTVPTVLQLPVVVAPAVRVSEVKKIVWNELLAYVSVYRHNSNDAALQKVVLTHFSHDDIADAKRTLVQEFQSVGGLTQHVTERRNSSARPACEAELDDITGILEVADTKEALAGYVFVAANLQALPKYGPEEINLGVVVDRQVQMEAAISSLSTSVQEMASSPPSVDSSTVAQQAMQSVAHDLQQQLGTFNTAISARLDHLNALCGQIAESAAAPRSGVASAPRAGRQTRDVDRSMNLMLFGIAENKEASVWRRAADKALQFIAGGTVDVADMLRVGRYAENKVRPIIVKLRCAWDRRIILIKASKLKEYDERVFIAADEPMDVRRKKMLERMKARAERDHKTVSVADGILSIDGVAVFSLRDGKLNNNGGH